MKNNIFLYERFDNEKNFNDLKKNFNLIKIGSKKKFKEEDVMVIFPKLNFNLNYKFLQNYENLKFIVSPTTGINHIDVKYCKKKRIKIIYFDKNKRKLLKNISSTTELALTFILSAIKRVNYFYDEVKKFHWDRYSQNLYQFKNYTVGIIGFGRIGKSITVKLKNLGFKVITYDKKTNNINKLNNLLKISDVISFHINSESNYNFFEKNKLKICKTNVSIINTSRGEIINEKDLINFLKKKQEFISFY